MKNIRNFLFGTLRGRLIISVAIVHAVMMTLFIVDLANRQRTMVLDRQEEGANALAQTLAVSSANWLSSFDIAGLQEIVDAQSRYPELLFAILTDKEGHIMAHTDRSKKGLFLTDLPTKKQLTVIYKTPGLVDVAVPVVLGNKQVGWARVGIGQKGSEQKIKAITRDGVFYALLAILIGSFIAWMMGRHITRRLYAVQHTMNLISAGNYSARTKLSGTDEPAKLANTFDTMLDILDESESRFKKMFNLTPIPLCFVNKEGVFVDFNDRFEQTFGYSHQDTPTLKEWWQLAYPDPEYRKWVIAKWESSIKRAIDNNIDIEPIEYQVTCKNGKVRTMIISGTTIKDDLLVIFIDITQRKQTEEALRRSEALQTKMVANIGDVIVIIDKDGIITFKSPNIEKWFGWKPQELIGQSVWGNVHPGNLDSTQNIFSAILCELNATNTTECRYRCKDGSYKWIELTWVNLLHDPDIQGLLGNYHDITERKQKEQELIIVNKELGCQNEEKEKRAEDLVIINKELQQLIQLNKDKNKFFSIITHDLRSPFNSIIGFSELLMEQIKEKDYEKIGEFANIILQSSNRAMDLLMNLMVWAQSQSGRMDFNPEYFDIITLIDEVTLILNDIAEQKSIHIASKLPASIQVNADKEMIKTVMRNLISNAIKFTQAEGKITISVVDKQNELIVSVSDTGVGISKDRIEKLFNISDGYSTPGTQNEKGTGLGLVLCKEFIDKNNGRIWVESKAGIETTFNFSLPLNLENRQNVDMLKK